MKKNIAVISWNLKLQMITYHILQQPKEGGIVIISF